ncbi:peptidoglycan-binding protein [Streptomyces sp. ME19-01-6]|uniref:peptidoglycan-binding protein n=1 Tax=Streptomyces sp. ME19-01-6 TaxID=3028686 RepID=UPI0029B0EDEE|nr:peptidoglycan-binding protein [Streptomyces sp. ME19-01-6]MDX3230810.1 peptidoglycan-binding protein [Streptomyces sp. ME19-01-6]
MQALKLSDDATFAFCLALSDAIGKARDTPTPIGDPDHIDGVAARYTRAAELLESAQGDLAKVAKAGLPAVWVGTAGEKASQVVGAASRSTDETAEKLREAVPVLRQLAIDIGAAQATDEYARVALDYAKSLCGPFFNDREQLLEAKKATLDGITYLIEADDRAKDGGKKAAVKLSKLAAQARTRKVTADGLTDADRLVIADAADPGGPADLNEILSTNELERSAQFRDKLSAQDQAEFDRLVSRAKSPEEGAYLMKALAAGYDIKTLRSFGEDIHGRDATWLREHLAPFHTSGDTRVGVDSAAEFDVPGAKGAEWTQGKNGTCVASSTVAARALVDPVYTLRLTTGGHPGDPAYDSPAAFEKRLLKEQIRVHKEGDGGPLPDAGMDLTGKHKVINDEIAPHTGATYEQREVRTADSRREALPLIEEAVDEGKPVPIGVQGFDTVDGERVPVGHAMMIVGHEGDKLEVYNPWGFTTWVSEDDFVNNHMDKASDKRLPTAYEYSLPK